MHLKILQIGNYEEKLRLLLMILDIDDTKIIRKSEFEKLLSFCGLQNYSPDNRVDNVVKLIYGRSLSSFVKYDYFYQKCINDIYCKEIISEILQVYSDETNN